MRHGRLRCPVVQPVSWIKAGGLRWGRGSRSRRLGCRRCAARAVLPAIARNCDSGPRLWVGNDFNEGVGTKAGRESLSVSISPNHLLREFSACEEVHISRARVLLRSKLVGDAETPRFDRNTAPNAA